MLSCLHTLPMIIEVILMKSGPFPDEDESFGRKVPLDEASMKVEKGFHLFLSGMKMGGIVILPVHENDNSKKSAENRHYWIA